MTYVQLIHKAKIIYSSNNKKIASKLVDIIWKIFRAFLLFGICFVLIYPLIYMLSMAFRPTSQLYDPSIIWIPKSYTLDNISEVFKLMDYPKAILTTLDVNVVSAFLQVMICAATGYGFARFDFKFKKLFFTFVMITIIVPYQIILSPLYMNFKSFDFMGILKLGSLIVQKDITINLLNSPLTFFLPSALGVGLKSGLIIFLFRQMFKGMPKELEDAAAIDGCGFFKCFIKIMIPNATSVIITSSVLSVVWYWNDNYIGSMLMSNHRTVMVALTNLQSQIYAQTQTIAVDPYMVITKLQAGSLLAIIPILILYLVIQKWFVQSVSRSGIVG